MNRRILILLCLITACNKVPRSQQRIDKDIRDFTLAVQHREDEPAKLCHRAVTNAAVVSANISAAAARPEPVPAAQYVELDNADRVMRSACARFR